MAPSVGAIDAHNMELSLSLQLMSALKKPGLGMHPNLQKFKDGVSMLAKVKLEISIHSS